MDEFSRAQLNKFKIFNNKSSAPLPGQVAFDENDQKIKIFNGQDWVILTNEGPCPDTLTEILKLIDNASPENLKKLLEKFDEVKNTLEKAYLCKC